VRLVFSGSSAAWIPFGNSLFFKKILPINRQDVDNLPPETDWIYVANSTLMRKMQQGKAELILATPLVIATDMNP
jgi:hypothetical protein